MIDERQDSFQILNAYEVPLLTSPGIQQDSFNACISGPSNICFWGVSYEKRLLRTEFMTSQGRLEYSCIGLGISDLA